MVWSSFSELVWFLLMRKVWCFSLLVQCCACNFLSPRNHKTKHSWYTHLKSTTVRERMYKLVSVLAVSYAFLSVELFIQKVEKILESVLEIEKLTLSRSLQFLLAGIDLELFMLWTEPYGIVSLEETAWKWVVIYFMQSLGQIWELTNEEDFIPRRHERPMLNL